MATKVTVEVDGKTTLIVKSNGMARFTVAGSHLRWKKENKNRAGYRTSNDLQVIGEILRELSAAYSAEVLKKALHDHEKGGE